MSKTYTHKIHIRPRNKDEILTGDNCQVSIDDVVVRGVKKVSFQIDSNSVGEVTVTILGNIEIEGLIPTNNLIVCKDQCPNCGALLLAEKIDSGYTSCPTCNITLKWREEECKKNGTNT